MPWDMVDGYSSSGHVFKNANLLFKASDGANLFCGGWMIKCNSDRIASKDGFWDVFVFLATCSTTKADYSTHTSKAGAKGEKAK